MLLALAAQPAHGYAIVREVERRSGGRVMPGTGSFYEVMQRLRSDGLIAEQRPEPGADARRRSYALTALGRAVLAAEAARLESLVNETRQLGVLATPRGARS